MGGDGQPRPSSRGAAEIGRLIENHGEWLGALRPAPAKVAILWSQDTDIMSIRETGPQHRPSEYSTRSAYGCFRTLWRAGIPAEMVTTEEISEGILGRFRCLMIPNGEVMDQVTGHIIADWLQAGGWLYGKTPLANKNERGSAEGTTPGAGLHAVLPTTLDMCPTRVAPTIQTPYGPIHTEAFVQPLGCQGSVANGRSLGTVRDFPVLWDSAVGLGHTRFVGTCHCLYAGQHDDAEAEFTLLADFAHQAGCEPEWHVQAASDAPAYWLADPASQCDALIIVNDSDRPNPVEIKLPQPYAETLKVLDDLPLDATDQVLRLTLKPRRGAVLKLSRA